jgi:hypothetical protein
VGVRSRFRNNLCKDDNALFSGFLLAHEEQVDVLVNSTVLCKNGRKPTHEKHLDVHLTVLCMVPDVALSKRKVPFTQGTGTTKSIQTYDTVSLNYSYLPFALSSRIISSNFLGSILILSSTSTSLHIVTNITNRCWPQAFLCKMPRDTQISIG